MPRGSTFGRCFEVVKEMNLEEWSFLFLYYDTDR